MEPVPDFISWLPLTSSNSLMLGIVQVNLALPSLNRDFPAIATFITSILIS